MIYPNYECYQLCVWMLTISSQRLTGSQITVTQNIQAAALAETGVTENEWNNFNEYAAWRNPYYLVYRDYQTTANADLLTSLFGYYALEGNSNDSLSTNNGTDTAVSYSLSYGKILQGASFNGSTSQILIGSASTHSFFQNTGVFAINLWYKMANNTGTFGLFGNTGTSAEKGIFCYQNSTGQLHLSMVNGSGAASQLLNMTLPRFFLDTSYHMLTISSDGTILKVYLDGVLKGASTLGTLSSGNSTRALTFGYLNGSSSRLNGYLDEIGIWSRALNYTEVQSLYNSGSGLTYPF